MANGIAADETRVSDVAGLICAIPFAIDARQRPGVQVPQRDPYLLSNPSFYGFDSRSLCLRVNPSSLSAVVMPNCMKSGTMCRYA